MDISFVLRRIGRILRSRKRIHEEREKVKRREKERQGEKIGAKTRIVRQTRRVCLAAIFFYFPLLTFD